nr:MFS transporter [Pontibacter sp. 172403-2]
MIADATIPVLYAAAMFADAVAALALGRLFDKIGIRALMLAVVLSLFFAPLVFAAHGSLTTALIGMILWGIGMGAQESIVKAEVARLIPAERRGTAYGLFNTAFGVFWFIGSVMMGYLYDFSLTGLILFSVLSQLVSVLILYIIHFNLKNDTDAQLNGGTAAEH